MWAANRFDSQAMKRRASTSPYAISRSKRHKVPPDDEEEPFLGAKASSGHSNVKPEAFTSWGSTNWLFDIPKASCVSAEDFLAVADCLGEDDDSTQSEPFLEPLQPNLTEEDLPKVALQGIAEAAFQAALRVTPQANPFNKSPPIVPFDYSEDSKPPAYIVTDKIPYDKQSDSQILSSVSKRACRLLEMVSALVDEMQKKLDPSIAQAIKPVAVGDLVYFTERMIEMQARFKREGKPTLVDVGYHYTRSTNMENIRQGGLMTRTERDASKINSSFNGAVHGDGVYTGNNPHAFHGFGRSDIGLLIARLKGQTKQSLPYQPTASTDPSNTGIAGAGVQEIAVLRSSSQCVALVQFNASLIKKWQRNHPGNKVVHDYQCRLQKILDDVFNGGRPTKVPEDILSKRHPASRQRQQRARPCSLLSSLLALPSVPPIVGSPSTNTQSSETVHYIAPTGLRSCGATNSLVEVGASCLPPMECSICLSDLNGHAPVASLADCGHFFHRSCICSALERSTKCPICRKPVGKPQGHSPSGRMVVSRSPLACAGNSPGSIVIDYRIQAGIQQSYHEKPGCPFAGTTRRAFLPDNNDGRKLLKRLKFAFSHGLTFTIGTSLTSGRSNVVTWASIHHKTSRCGGTYSFPDQGYFYNCNQELDNLNVPAAEDL